MRAFSTSCRRWATIFSPSRFMSRSRRTDALAVVVGGDMPGLSTAVVLEMLHVAAEGAVDAVVEELLRNDEVTDDEAYKLYQSGENALRATLVETDRIANIVFWNDATHRTQQDVLDLFDLAAQRAAGE